MRKMLPPACFLGAIVLGVALHVLLPIPQLLGFRCDWSRCCLAPLGWR